MSGGIPDPNAPLIAGVAQMTWRDGAPGPIEMLCEVAGGAAADCKASGDVMSRIDALCVVKYVSADHADPARAISDRLGIEPRMRIHTTIGGDTPQAAVGEFAGRIAAGELDACILCGCEALSTFAAATKAGENPGWQDQTPGSQPTEILGVDREPNLPEETAAGMIAPLMIYPLFEHALWARNSTSLDDHMTRLGRLMERFSRVAADNPHAWTDEFPDAGSIITPNPANRQVTFPYTKVMNANIQTDQAAAVVLMSQRLADELSVARDRRVYLHGAAKATEPWFVANRDSLANAPALGAAANAAYAAAGSGIDDIALLDIYSCFPSAVQIAGDELGVDVLDDPREPTVTGGLSFAGGPGNAYVFHSIASIVERLREAPQDKGLVTAVGWYMTKHAVGIYGCAPPSTKFGRQAVLDEPPAVRRQAAADWSGGASAESATVLYERDGSPSMAIVTALTPEGTRALASSTDQAVLERVLSGTPVTGSPVERATDGALHFGA